MSTPVAICWSQLLWRTPLCGNLYTSAHAEPERFELCVYLMPRSFDYVHACQRCVLVAEYLRANHMHNGRFSNPKGFKTIQKQARAMRMLFEAQHATGCRDTIPTTTETLRRSAVLNTLANYGAK